MFLLKPPEGGVGQAIVGVETSFPVNVTSQVAVFPAASVAVMVTGCVWPCDELKTVPAAGFWVNVTAPEQLSDHAGSGDNKFGTTNSQLAFRVTGRVVGVGQVNVGGSWSSTVTTC